MCGCTPQNDIDDFDPIILKEHQTQHPYHIYSSEGEEGDINIPLNNGKQFPDANRNLRRSVKNKRRNTKKSSKSMGRLDSQTIPEDLNESLKDSMRSKSKNTFMSPKSDKSPDLVINTGVE